MIDKNKTLPVNLSGPALRALANAKITSLQQLCLYSEKEIAALHGIGNDAIKKLTLALAENGLSFAKEKNNKN